MRRYPCILLVMLALAAGSRAQGIRDTVFELNTVEVVAGRAGMLEQPGMKTSRIDSLALQQHISGSLSDLLSENTPVFIRNHGRGALATASFRGTAASHTRVRWNGVPINSPMTGMVDFSLLPVYIADGVELRHGAASIAEGSGGIGGSVEISNTVDWDHRFGLKYMQGIGSYCSFDEFLHFGIGNSKFQSKTRIYHNYSANDYTFINRGIAEIDPVTGDITNPLDTNKDASYTRYGLLQELYYRAGERHVLSARWWVQKAGRTIPQATSYEGPEHSNLNRQDDLDNRVVLEWKHYGERHRLEARSAYAGKQLDYRLVNRVAGLGDVPAIYSESRTNSFLNTLKLDYDLSQGFSLEGAADMNYHAVESRDSVAKTGYEKDRVEISLFFNLRKELWNRLSLDLMLRQDITDGALAPFVPYFGFSWKVIRDKALVVRGNIARNYHQPTLNDLYWQPGGNPDLLPEKGMSAELGVDHTIKAGKHELEVSAGVYYSDIGDWIIWLPGFKGYWEPRNIDRVESKGMELDLSLGGTFGRFAYSIAGHYAYTSSRNYGDPLVWGDEAYGKQLVYIPLHSGNLMVNLAFMGFYATYRHNSYSERYTTSSNDITKRDWLYPYFMNDLSFGKSFRAGKVSLSAEFKIYNLFDETYHTVLYRPMPGRNYMLLLMISI